MTVRILLAIFLPFLAGACGSGVPASPDVVLVVLGDLPLERCSFAGYGRRTTVALDGLAAKGTVLPVRPDALGEAVLLPFLPSAFRDAGYRTALLVERAEPPLAGAGVRAAFDEVHELDDGEEMMVSAAQRIHRQAFRLLARAEDAGRPLFLAIRHAEPRPPYEAPGGPVAEFLRGEPPRSLLQRAWRYRGPGDGPVDGELRAVIDDLRDAETARLDTELAALLAGIDALDATDRTVFAVVAIPAGDGPAPFVVRYPPAVPAGRRIEEAALLPDVGPTLLELAGLPVPAGTPGISRADALRGRTAATPR